MNSTFELELEKTGQLIYCNKGVSMRPLIRQGKDLMVIKKVTEPPKKYDAILYKRQNGQYVLHRILKVKNQGYVLCGDNMYTLEHDVKPEQVLGILTAVIRGGKEIPVTNKFYKLYVHLWCDFFIIRAPIIYLRNLLVAVLRKLFYAKKREQF